MYRPELWPRMWVRVMCDWSASPTWNAGGAPESPQSLPIPDALANDLDAWFLSFDQRDPFADQDEHEDPAWFPTWNTQGFALACRLRRALPDGWTVVYFDSAMLNHPDADANREVFEYTITPSMATGETPQPTPPPAA